MTEKKELSDIHFNSWVDRLLPAGWRPYARLARLDRPVGTWLTLLPCIAALVQASHGVHDIIRLGIFSLGALIMRSAGSTANDIADRNFDAHVERTRFRPLASGALKVKQALAFLFFELILAASLLIFLNPLSRWLAVGLVPVVLIYPLCKRFTYWPQAPLGMAFNWGMLMAWSDTNGIVPAGAIAMWLGAVCWQVGYDSIYAYADIADDAKLKLKSTALLFSDKGRQWIGSFYAATIALWSFGGIHLNMSTAYFIVIFLITLHFSWQIKTFSIHQPNQSLNLFRANVLVGMLLLLAAIFGSF
ncbi:4-hydroxybenzoate octaprenyltransferase [Pantoea ananatis]|uniref:4-hydroxybenzoate octaprenyltransferase n=1 Tax=Pantoea ananas TaxID=553 RepID=UPI0023B1E4EC|nr:4-hydroxybenzoate octaprenyltransferase [Pantoea ananatis]